MTTTTRMRAGTVYGCAFKDCNRPAGPCAGNCQLHRVMPEHVERDEEAIAQASTLPNAIQFAGDEPDVQTVEQFDRDAAEIAWIGWLQIAALLVFIFTGIGYLAGRYFS